MPREDVQMPRHITGIAVIELATTEKRVHYDIASLRHHECQTGEE